MDFWLKIEDLLSQPTVASSTSKDAGKKDEIDTS